MCVVKLSTCANALTNRSPTSTSFPSFPTYSSPRHCTSSQNCQFAFVFTRCVLICNSMCPPSSPLPCRTTNASSAYSTRFAPLGMPPNAFTSSSATTKKKPPPPSPPPRVCCGEEKKQIVTISSSSDITRRSKIKGFDITILLFLSSLSFSLFYRFLHKKKESARARVSRDDVMIRRGERERKRGKKNVVVVVKFLRTFTVSVSVLAYFFLLLFRVLIFLEKIESKKGEENKKKNKKRAR